LCGRARHLEIICSAAEGGSGGPDVAITLTFNSRIDVKRSQIAVVGQGNSERKLSLGNQPSPDVVATVAKGLQNGHYVVRWQVLASDGHISRGEIPFEVR